MKAHGRGFVPIMDGGSLLRMSVAPLASSSNVNHSLESQVWLVVAVGEPLRAPLLCRFPKPHGRSTWYASCSPAVERKCFPHLCLPLRRALHRCRLQQRCPRPQHMCRPRRVPSSNLVIPTGNGSQGVGAVVDDEDSERSTPYLYGHSTLLVAHSCGLLSSTAPRWVRAAPLRYCLKSIMREMKGWLISRHN